MVSRIVGVLAVLIVIIAGICAIYLRQSSQPLHQLVIPSSISKPLEVSFIVPLKKNAKTYSIGLIGETRGDDHTGESFNADVLKKLLKVLITKKVQAIIFTGDIVSGWIKNNSNTTTPITESALYENQLNEFSTFVSENLGPNTPFFVVMGHREIAAPDGENVVSKVFHLPKSQIEPKNLGYTIAVGDALFVIISTEEYNLQKKEAIENYSPEMLTWLQDALKRGSLHYKYLFVVGFSPVFSSKLIRSEVLMHQHEAFWKILVDNNVKAYFSSKEHLFDRSNRHGVWQVVSGGGGAPIAEGGGDEPFFHCLLLTIPVTGKEEAKIEVLDQKGNVGDEFELNLQEGGFLFQRRIS